MIAWYWHVHHNIFAEPLTEPIEKRIAFIKANKPKEEVETRLRLLKPIKALLPADVVKTWEAYDKAREAGDKAWEAYVKTWEAYNKTLNDHKDEIDALHREECPNCPWDGETIFPEEKKENPS